jgi:hypothetical protein
MAKPTHIAYDVENFKLDGKPDASSWSRIGVAFEHKDGKGFDVTLRSLPLSGRITLRKNEPKPKE